MNLAEKSKPAVTSAAKHKTVLSIDFSKEIVTPGFMAIPAVYAPDLEFDYPAPGGALANSAAGRN